MRLISFSLLAAAAFLTPALTGQSAAAQAAEPIPTAKRLAADLPSIRKNFRSWMVQNNVPGLVYGIVKDGQLLHIEGIGYQDANGKEAVTPDTAFRIASMSKAFTAYEILSLQADGKLRLDDLVSTHVPEVKDWAGQITIRDLLHHTAGFVTDDPWGDRQQPLSEADFTHMLKQGVPFNSTPGTRYEYSNFGYATLGRIIRNVSGQSYQAQIRNRVFMPLGMASTTYDVTAVPQARLAKPWRWLDNKWQAEPTMADGTFGAMGGVVTTGNDYAKWISHLLSGWPATETDSKSNTIRAMRMGGGFTHNRPRPGKDSPDCRLRMTYAGGLVAGNDCTLGEVMFHSGGYPGYGSHMLLLPDAGLGVFAFTNRTYAAPLPPVWDMAGILSRSGLTATHTASVSPALATAYEGTKQIWKTGKITTKPTILASNMLQDAPERAWTRTLRDLRTQAGQCKTNAQITATGQLAGTFIWDCSNGQLNGQILLAPTHQSQIQALRLSFSKN